MARPMHKLTANRLPNMPPGRHADGGGLYFSVENDGKARGWLFRFKRDGVDSWRGMGGYPALSLAQARDKAATWRSLVAEGKDPRVVREATAAEKRKATRTVSDVADAFVKARAPSWRPNMLKAVEGLVRAIKVGIGEQPIATLTADDVLRWLEPEWHRVPARATKMRGVVEQVCDYASVRGWRSEDAANPAAWKRLRFTLPKPGSVKPVVHHRSLAHEQMPAFWSALSSREGAGADCLRYLILTGARASEAAGARWDEIEDLDGPAPTWRIGASRMKAGREHLVPLSPAAVIVLRRRLEDRRGALVFAGIRAAKPISAATMQATVERMGGDWSARFTPHGARASVRSWCAAEGVAQEVAELLLAHTPDAVVRAYQRDTLLPQRRDALERWSSHVTGDALAVHRKRTRA